MRLLAPFQSVPSLFAGPNARDKTSPSPLQRRHLEANRRFKAIPPRATNRSNPAVAPTLPGSNMPRYVVRCRLLHSRAAALNQNHQNHECNSTRDYSDNHGIVHDALPFLFPCYLPVKVLNESIITMAAGPSVTRNSAGKMNRTRGNTSLTEVFAANSSIICTRCTRSVSA